MIVTLAESSIAEYSQSFLPLFITSSLRQRTRAVSVAVSGVSHRKTASSHGCEDDGKKMARSIQPWRIGGEEPSPKSELMIRSSRYSSSPALAVRSYICPAGRPISEVIIVSSTLRQDTYSFGAQATNDISREIKHKITIATFFISTHLFSF